MCADSTLILLVREAGWRLGLRIAVVISCHLRLIWRGIAVTVAVIPSTRSVSV